MSIQPYLNFEGRCEEAVEFYRRALGAEVTSLVRHADDPGAGGGETAAESPEKVLHASFRVGGTTIMAHDGRCTGRPNFDGFSLSIIAPDGVRAGRILAALGDGGRVRMPLTKTFAARSFGVVVDRFGVSWTVAVAA